MFLSISIHGNGKQKCNRDEITSHFSNESNPSVERAAVDQKPPTSFTDVFDNLCFAGCALHACCFLRVSTWQPLWALRPALWFESVPGNQLLTQPPSLPKTTCSRATGGRWAVSMHVTSSPAKAFKKSLQFCLSFLPPPPQLDSAKMMKTEEPLGLWKPGGLHRPASYLSLVGEPR